MIVAALEMDLKTCYTIRVFHSHSLLLSLTFLISARTAAFSSSNEISLDSGRIFSAAFVSAEKEKVIH